MASLLMLGYAIANPTYWRYMSNTIGGITLPTHAIWTPETEIGWNAVKSTVRMSLNQTPNVWERTLSGRIMDIAGGASYGWITRGTLASIKALVIPGAAHILVYDSVSYTVRFRSEEDDPVSATPVQDFSDKSDDDWYNNFRMLLMEI